LHGVWDSSDPIGSHVYAHTNLTEIDSALDLLWRNDITADKINLGIGFYGRSFQLKDSSCFSPGCDFAGAGKKGKCTATAGILSYAEIQDIISSTGATPVVDEEAAVNYMVYGGDNWVSYDDRATFQQKVDFANKRGLGGLLIWSIDMDDDQFSALKAVTGKTDILTTPAESHVYTGLEDIDKCYITDCGGSCKNGDKLMTHLNLKDKQGCPNASKNKGQRSCKHPTVYFFCSLQFLPSILWLDRSNKKRRYSEQVERNGALICQLTRLLSPIWLS
jgi:chitinase